MILQRISNWYFTKKALPHLCILLIDCAIVAFSGYVGYYIDKGGDIFVDSFWQITFGLMVGLVPFIVAFRLLHTYSGIVRSSQTRSAVIGAAYRIIRAGVRLLSSSR